MKKESVVFQTKLGTAKGIERSRIWIEGKRLVDAGFTVGQHFVKDWDDHSKRPILRLTLCKSEDDVITTAPCKVSGKGTKPIIDITGANVRDVFGVHGTHVQVEYADGLITITVPH